MRADLLTEAMPPPPPASPMTVLHALECERDYSSVWSGEHCGVGHARSMLTSPQAWSAQHNAVGEWMSIDAGGPRTVYGVRVKKRTAHNQYVTLYRVQYSPDEVNWADVDDGAVFRGSRRDDGVNDIRDGIFETPVTARYIRIVVQGWVNHVSMRADLLVEPVAPPPPASPMTVVNVNECDREYSSVWSGELCGTGHARSMLTSPQAWSAQNNAVGEWMSIDAGGPLTVYGVRVKKRHMTGHEQYVTNYKVMYSTDNVNWADVDGGAVFRGSRRDDAIEAIRDAIFETPVEARYIKIVVQSWVNHVSMRAGLLTELMPPPPPSSPTAVVHVLECERDYSSVWSGEHCGVGHARSMLNSPQAWSAARNAVGEWMMLDAGGVLPVQGIRLQKRTTCCSQYVTSFTVQTSSDLVSWSDVDGGAVFRGSRKADGDNDIRNAYFSEAVEARYVKIIVQSWNNHISMRADLLADPMPPPPPAPAMAVFDTHECETRSYSSVWANDRCNIGHRRSLLSSPQAWSAQRNVEGEWMMIDAGWDNNNQPRTIYGVRVKKRTAYDQYVTLYTVLGSLDGANWFQIESDSISVSHGAGTSSLWSFRGSRQGDGVDVARDGMFAAPVTARFIKIVVHGWSNHISMRAGLLVAA